MGYKDVSDYWLLNDACAYDISIYIYQPIRCLHAMVSVYSSSQSSSFVDLHNILFVVSSVGLRFSALFNFTISIRFDSFLLLIYLDSVHICVQLCTCHLMAISRVNKNMMSMLHVSVFFFLPLNMQVNGRKGS